MSNQDPNSRKRKEPFNLLEDIIPPLEKPEPTFPISKASNPQTKNPQNTEQKPAQKKPVREPQPEYVDKLPQQRQRRNQGPGNFGTYWLPIWLLIAVCVGVSAVLFVLLLTK